MSFCSVPAHFLLLFGYLSFATPVATHLHHVIYHLVISRTFWCRSFLHCFLQPSCEMLAFLLHILIDDHFFVSAFRMFITLFSHHCFHIVGNALHFVLLTGVALCEALEILIAQLLSCFLGLVQSVSQIIDKLLNVEDPCEGFAR